MDTPTLVVCTMIVRVMILQHITEVPSAGSAERERPTASRACVPHELRLTLHGVTVTPA